MFSPDYFTERYDNEWGDAINFDGEQRAAGARVRHRERRATGSTSSTSTGCGSTRRSRSSTRRRAHILAELTAARARPRRPRRSLLVAENEPQDVAAAATAEDGGYGLDALWNDDFHHAGARRADRHDARPTYTDYRGTPQEFVSAAKYGFLYQGQRYPWQKQPRGTPTRGLAAASASSLPREPRSGRQHAARASGSASAHQSRRATAR